LGSLPIFDGKPIVILNETVLQIDEISGIIILFIAGLQITPREFLRRGFASFKGSWRVLIDNPWGTE